MNKAKGQIKEGSVLAMPTPKTVIVGVSVAKKHPIYKKTMRKTRRFAAHNESLTLAVGDTVRIRETKPMSSTKHFIVEEKL